MWLGCSPVPYEKTDMMLNRRGGGGEGGGGGGWGGGGAFNLAKRLVLMKWKI